MLTLTDASYCEPALRNNIIMNKSFNLFLSFFIFYRAFYSVLLGYCGYFAFFFMVTSLPETLEIAESHFDDLLVTLKNNDFDHI